MAELKINYSDLETAIHLSKDISDEINESYQTVSELKSFLETARWSGQTKLSFQAYLDLIHQYHNDLKGIMKDHQTAVQDLKTSIDEYNNSSEVASIKEL